MRFHRGAAPLLYADREAYYAAVAELLEGQPGISDSTGVRDVREARRLDSNGRNRRSRRGARENNTPTRRVGTWARGTSFALQFVADDKVCS